MYGKLFAASSAGKQARRFDKRHSTCRCSALAVSMRSGVQWSERCHNGREHPHMDVRVGLQAKQDKRSRRGDTDPWLIFGEFRMNELGRSREGNSAFNCKSVSPQVKMVGTIKRMRRRSR
jgi:hypothetical protein